MSSAESDAFRARLGGSFSGILKWEALDALWGKVKTGQWYFYQLGEALPEKPLSGDELAMRIDALDTLLHHDHEYHYCGIVYADDVESPALIKVYDPNNIGSSCSRSDTPSPPGWILSTVPPSPVEIFVPVPGNRRRWWQRYFHGK